MVLGQCDRGPSTTAPFDARSAIVSASRILQSSIRESTISSPAMTSEIASRAAATVTPGPFSGAPSRKTISASTLGAMNAPSGVVAPFSYTVEASTGP